MGLIVPITLPYWDYCTEVLRVAELAVPDGLLGEAVEDRRAFLAAHIEADPFMDAQHWGWIVDDILDVARERYPAVVAEAQACP